VGDNRFSRPNLSRMSRLRICLSVCSLRCGLYSQQREESFGNSKEISWEFFCVLGVVRVRECVFLQPGPSRERCAWNLTDEISTAGLIHNLFGEWCAGPSQSCSPVATECAYANTSCVCGIAVIPNYSIPARRCRCGTGFSFEHAGALRKRSA
jgi:hypothetical protein